MRISDWSSDVCSSDLAENIPPPPLAPEQAVQPGSVVEEPVIAPASGAPDTLLPLKGVGPKVNAMLYGLGFTRFDQHAAWPDSDIAAWDMRLGTCSGRIIRNHLLDQAGYFPIDIGSAEMRG